MKVGDKVRIISDTSFSELRKLKIGSIGKIVEIADGHTMSQKPKLWVKVEFDDKVINQYFSSEVEVVTDNAPKFKVGDKVRVIKQVEFLSIAEFGKDAVIDKDIGNNQYLISFNHPKTGKYCFRVTNDQIELIEEDHEEITPENIAEVLRYNGITNWKADKNCVYQINKSLHKWFEYPKWLQHLELEVGKLKPLPKKKEPTLEEVLVELGFEEIRYNYYKNEKKGIYICILHNSNNKFWIGKSRGTLIPPYELKTYTTKEQLAKDIAAFEEKHKFRQHWSLVDDGGHGKEIGKIYRDEIKEKVNSGLLVIGAVLHTLFMNYEHSQPYQYINKESDFGILCKDGSLIKAFWRGEE